jgi:hypothetical protein
MNKNSYYYNFKTQLGGRSESRIKLTIDPNQRKNKNDYYHSFKTQRRGRSRAKPES